MDNTCTFNDFMSSLKPWLSDEYIREAAIESENTIRLLFTDGITDIYHIQDCSPAQVEDIVTQLQKNGIPVRQ